VAPARTDRPLNRFRARSRKPCVQCNATYKALDKQGVDYAVVDITTDPEAGGSACC
jgi:glutaredoxin